MSTALPTETDTDDGATVVITHRLRENTQEKYESWLKEIGPICSASPGYLDLHIIRPILGLTDTYTVIIRFQTEAHLRGWIESPTRARLIDKVRPLFAEDDDFRISSGLDFWFTPEGGKARVPVRWKQFLVTWSAIYPLVLVIPLLVTLALQYFGAPTTRYIVTLAATGIIVFLMVYIVMPRYTGLVHKWLFR